MAMLRITSSKVVLNAVRVVSSGRALCASITNAFNGCDQAYTVPFATSHHFCTDAKKQIDRKLMKLLKSEIKFKQILLEREMPALPRNFPFTVKDDPNDIILTRDFGGEKIDVVVVMPDNMAEYESDSDASSTDVDDEASDDDDDDISSSDDDSEGEDKEKQKRKKEPLLLTVTISREDGEISEFKVIACGDEVKIKSFSLKGPATEESSQPLLSYGTHVVEEEGHLQNALGEFLKDRGIKKNCYEFLYKYMVKKFRKRPVVALKKLREFIAD